MMEGTDDEGAAARPNPSVEQQVANCTLLLVLLVACCLLNVYCSAVGYAFTSSRQLTLTT